MIFDLLSKYYEKYKYRIYALAKAQGCMMLLIILWTKDPNKCSGLFIFLILHVSNIMRV